MIVQGLLFIEYCYVAKDNMTFREYTLSVYLSGTTLEAQFVCVHTATRLKLQLETVWFQRTDNCPYLSLEDEDSRQLNALHHLQSHT